MVQRILKLRCESLESRHLLTQFGIPWPEPSALTISFPRDGTDIGRFPSDLAANMDGLALDMEWQEAILAGFQEWARYANIEFALAPDDGSRFGTLGLAQGDPRFGDIRVGGFNQTDVLANSLPYGRSVGSWAGDLFFNTTPGLYGEKAADLQTVALHEAGNILGLADNLNPDSILYQYYSGTHQHLSATDIAAIQALYGPRPADRFEITSNGSLSTATSIHVRRMEAETTGEITPDGDVDFYRVTVPENATAAQVRLEAQGESLLVGQLDIYHEDGTQFGSSDADGPLFNDVSIDLDNPPGGQPIFIGIRAESDDDHEMFGFGRYGLEIEFFSNFPGFDGEEEDEGDDDDDGPEIPDDDFDDDDDDGPEIPDDGFDDDDDNDDFKSVDQLFARVGLIDLETQANNSLETATVLTTPPGFVEGTRYEAVGSLASTSDVDVYRIRSSDSPDPLLHLDASPVGSALEVGLTLLNTAGETLAESSPRIDGHASLVYSNVAPNTEYFVRVTRSPTNDASEGNYVLLADFGQENVPLEVIAAGTLDSTETEKSGQLHVGTTQLFQLSFSVSAEDPHAEAAVVLQIYNDAGERIFVTTARNGQQLTEYVWLNRGSYVARLTAITPDGEPIPNMTFELKGAGISDDIGPYPIDTTQEPQADAYGGYGTGGYYDYFFEWCSGSSSFCFYYDPIYDYWYYVYR